MFSMIVKKALPTFAAALLFTGIATSAHAATDNDPLEPFNRAMFTFNRTVDRFLLRPVASGYRYITPQPIRNSIGNASDNIFEPVNMLNAFLQGDFNQGVVSFWRFVLNTTVGIGGLNDVATEAGLPRRTEDFGQTLAVWGVGSGPYIVWPLIGPSNPRDTVGFVADVFTNPITYYVERDDLYLIGAAQMVVLRERWLDQMDEIYDSSLDPYVTFRSMYQQRREAQITNRNRDRARPY